MKERMNEKKTSTFGNCNMRSPHLSLVLRMPSLCTHLSTFIQIISNFHLIKMEASPLVPYNTVNRNIIPGEVRFGFGNPITVEAQQIVHNVANYLRARGFGACLISETSDATGISYKSVQNILSTPPTPPTPKTNKRRKFDKIDSFTTDLVKNKIYDGFRIKMLFTVDMLMQELNLCMESEGGFPYKKTQTTKLLH